MNLIHRGRVARFATVPQNTTTLRSPFPRGEGFFAFPSGAGKRLPPGGRWHFAICRHGAFRFAK